MASRLSSNAALLDPISAISTEELHKNFHVLEHSTEDIQDTQIFFLGNTHYLQEHAWKIEWFIQRLYQKGDVVLVEYSGKYPRLFQTLRYSTPAMLPLDLKGWDSSVKKDKIEEKECLSNKERLCAEKLHDEASSSISEFRTPLNQPHDNLQI